MVTGLLGVLGGQKKASRYYSHITYATRDSPQLDVHLSSETSENANYHVRMVLAKTASNNGSQTETKRTMRSAVSMLHKTLKKILTDPFRNSRIVVFQIVATIVVTTAHALIVLLEVYLPTYLPSCNGLII